MPGGDRTGPMGAGPMTGRGVGICAGFGTPGYMNPGYGRGFGGGFGRGFGRGMGRGFGGGGRGWRNMYYATGLPGWARANYPAAPGEQYWEGEQSVRDELSALRQESKQLTKTLESINKRIEELQEQKEG